LYRKVKGKGICHIHSVLPKVFKPKILQKDVKIKDTTFLNPIDDKGIDQE
jgi:hypothetical protein